MGEMANPADFSSVPDEALSIARDLLASAQKSFELGFVQVVRGGKSAIAPDGVPYVVVASGGIKTEGDRSPATYPSANRAVEAWFKSAKEVAAGDTVLYWRCEPEIDGQFVRPCNKGGVVMDLPKETHPYFEPVCEQWKVYSRFHTTNEQPAGGI